MPDLEPKKQSDTIKLEHVAFKVAGATILKPLSVSFPCRGITGLIGQNGSGKSTLLRILARQQEPTTGKVWFEGKTLQDWGEREFARKVAYLPQYTPLASGLTVRELVALGRYPWHGPFGRFGRTDNEKVDEALALTSTASLSDRFVDTLSGGERQRVWLAMLLAQNARLLLLDEPISALDVAHQVAVLDLVHRLATKNGIGVIIVIHDINLAARYCDQIVALKDGRMIAEGSAREFMTVERLAEVYDVTMGVLPVPGTAATIAYVRT
jgi:iron complex transport system ATP-binding protein